tara:strand:- start:952 stop:1176 length:225 start_codon:yes stop_codon:yes gene_type:complete
MVNRFTKKDRKATQIALIGIKTMTQTNQIKQEKVRKSTHNMRKNNGIKWNELPEEIEYDDASYDAIDIDYTTQS